MLLVNFLCGILDKEYSCTLIILNLMFKQFAFEYINCDQMFENFAAILQYAIIHASIIYIENDTKVS